MRVKHFEDAEASERIKIVDVEWTHRNDKIYCLPLSCER